MIIPKLLKGRPEEELYVTDVISINGHPIVIYVNDVCIYTYHFEELEENGWFTYGSTRLVTLISLIQLVNLRFGHKSFKSSKNDFIQHFDPS